MTNIRRYRLPASAVFITAVCRNRVPYLHPESEKQRLLDIMRELKDEQPYAMIAYVILDDHFHWLIRPKGTTNFSKLMQALKLRFTRRFIRDHPGQIIEHLWQIRFWDHVIRDQDDLHRHIDYIHYNPVKHGHAASPMGYPWCSFQAYLEKGAYPRDWGSRDEIAHVSGMELE